MNATSIKSASAFLLAASALALATAAGAADAADAPKGSAGKAVTANACLDKSGTIGDL